MTTTMDIASFSSEIPFSLFLPDAEQHSIHDLSHGNKEFLLHQFLLNVLFNIPSSSTDIDDIIEGCRRVNMTDPGADVDMQQRDIERFQMNYTSTSVFEWYTSDSFVYRAFNKACRTLNSDAIVRFHRMIKDCDRELRNLHAQQRMDQILTLPLTVYRGQTHLGKNELDKIRANIDGLISMNTFLSTTLRSTVATVFISGSKETTPVLFEITVNDTSNDQRLGTFADISKISKMKDEQEIVFSISSVFKVISVEDYDVFWIVKLELTNVEEDEHVQKYINEVKSYTYQITSKQTPIIALKQLITIDSHSYARPLIELMKFFLTDVTKQFVVNVCRKEGQIKQLIEKEPILNSLAIQTDTDVIYPKTRSVCLLLDIFDKFISSKKDHEDKRDMFGDNDGLSLLCFGGFLMLTGDFLKGIQYIEMLLKHESINEKLKVFLHGLLGASYAILKDNDQASQAFQFVFKAFQSSTVQAMPPWFAACMASSHVVLCDSESQVNDIATMLTPMIHEERSKTVVDEKLRLFYLGHICLEEQNFVDALNYWEEAVEIESYMPSTAEIIYNGMIYLQMSAGYLTMNNMLQSLKTMEKAKTCLELYYPSTHQMFAGINLMYGYYLMQNGKTPEAIKSLEDAWKNPHFSTNENFLSIVLILLAMASLQDGDVDHAESYCEQARAYPWPTTIPLQGSDLLKTIQQLKIFVPLVNKDYFREIVSGGMRQGQQILSSLLPNPQTVVASIDEETCTYEKFVSIADHYRHRNEHESAEKYYIKAMDKMTAADWKPMWNVYRKMIRMNSDGYRDYFSEQFSKYSDDNPEHLPMIATLQLIFYRLSLVQNDFQCGFDCLISSVMITMTSFYHQMNVDPKCISSLLDDFFHQDQIAEIVFLLTQLIEKHSVDWKMHVLNFLTRYFSLDDFVSIIHHPQFDATLHEMRSNYENNESSKTIFRFFDTLMQVFRQSIMPTETPTLSLSAELLKFLTKYNDQNSSLYYLIETLKSLCIDDHESFVSNLNRLQLHTITFERYEQLRDKISDFFATLEEHQLYAYLKNITKNLST